EEPEVEIIESPNEEDLFNKIDALHKERFDISRKNLCSFVAFSISNERFGLFEKAHHLVADGISATVVVREIIETYKALDSQVPADIKKEYNYLDFLDSEKEYLASPKYQKDKDYWLHRFDDFQGDDLNFKFNQNKKNSLAVSRRNFNLPADAGKLLDAYKSENRLSYFALFMAAMGIYFNRFFDHDDLVIGMPVHNRSKKIFKNMAGMFVSTLPFRIKFEDDWCFNDLIAYLKKELWNALKHQSYPFNHLVKEMADAGIDTGGLLNVQLIELPGANDEEIKNRSFFSTAYNISQLSVYLNQQNSKDMEELEVAVDYHGDIFAPKEIDAFFNRLLVILEQGIKNPDKPLAELPLLTDAEYKRVIHDLNDTAASFPDTKTLPQLFEEQVAKNPGNIALEFEDKTVSYEELNLLAGKLAVKLQGAGIAPDSIVGILFERSIEAIICIWGILKAGGAYLPIDRSYPAERKNYIIENSGIKIVLTEKDLEPEELQLVENHSDVINISVDYQALKDEAPTGTFVKPTIAVDNLAYVIYTSGTTGNPKGTLLRHRNAVNYLCWGAKSYVQDRETSFPLFSSLSFDLTVTSLFIPLITGNKLVIYRDYEEGLLIEKVVRDNKANVIKLTPSHLKIVRELKCDTSSIRSFIVGGEELKTDTAAEIYDFFDGNINIFNEYGPTETAVGCMIHAFDKNKDTGSAVPIGKPADNVQIYFLDKQLRPLPMGVIGEIYIGGKGVAKGYHKNDALSAEKFVDNPFAPGEKMYKSGDLGRWNLDETLEFYGRCDEQVKIRGFRIEPAEIEVQLKKLDYTKDAVVVVVEKANQKSLCAYMVPDENAGDDWFDIKVFRKKLNENLPDYMVPSFFVQMDNIPLTNNGKVDKRALPEPKASTGKGPDLPTGELEEGIKKIWGDVLGVDAPGMEDNFFDLGGDSIKAVQISSRMNDRDLSVNAKDILEFQTINQLILNVDFQREKKVYHQGLLEGEKENSPIESWFFDNNLANPHYFNLSVLLEFNDDISREILEKCFDLLIKHHDGLRINANLEKKSLFYNNDHLKKGFTIESVDISGSNWKEKIEEIGIKTKSSLDIEKSLLIKPVILNCDDGKLKLLITAHHLVIDGVSWRILLEDLYNLYLGFMKGEEPTLPSKTASSADSIQNQ
ncbi:MAG: amino acid adenylation domain-containing protein, partial [bacterium]|nr:amino acid adenylation domain-containing protein [bacterium]